MGGGGESDDQKDQGSVQKAYGEAEEEYLDRGGGAGDRGDIAGVSGADGAVGGEYEAATDLQCGEGSKGGGAELRRGVGE